MTAPAAPPWTVRLVIFDVFNTLVLPESGQEHTFAEGLRARGVEPTEKLIRTLISASEGQCHRQESMSRDSYVAWATSLLAKVASDGVDGDHASGVIPALEQLHQAPMRVLPGVKELLVELRRRGILVAACSNWGWDLSADLESCGLRGAIDVVAASACVGFRKPHPEIYQHILTATGIAASEALFVGDSFDADVRGPMRANIKAIHLVDPKVHSESRWRAGDIGEVLAFLT